jgi:hypothetical protein
MMASSLIQHAMSKRVDVLNRAEAYLSKFLDIMVMLEVHRGKDAEQEGWDLLNN